MKSHLSSNWAIPLLLLVLGGCGPKQVEYPDLTTTPILGSIKVDGEPASMLTVEIYPEAGSSEKIEPVVARTNPDGDLQFAMGELPGGTYNLVFKWQQIGTKSDLLKGAYANTYRDPTKSKHKLTVVDGEPIDFGEIELSTKSSAN